MSDTKPTLDDLRIDRSHRPQPRQRSGLIIAAVILVVIAALVAWQFTRQKSIAVRTAVAREVSAGGGGGDRTVLNASGYVTARRAATVSAKVTGKVTEVLIEEGMLVKEGQVLARLDDTNVKTSLDVTEAQLDSARSALEETRAQLKQAENEYHRTTELAKQNIASQSDLDLAESNANTLRARLARQERDVTVADRQVAFYRQQMDDMIIRAPFSGVITTKDAQPGEMISPISAGGGFTRTGIGTVVDMKSLEIEIDVNESSIDRVEPGQPVEAILDPYPTWKIPCKVIAIIPTADRQKSTVKVRVGFDQLDPRILPDMSVKVAFLKMDAAAPAASHARTITVPKSAVQQRDGHDIVFIMQNGKVERRAITVSSTESDDAVVSAGVAAGDRVVVDPPADLADGAEVKESPQ